MVASNAGWYCPPASRQVGGLSVSSFLSSFRLRLRHLSFVPFSTATEAGRQSERTRRIALTAATGLLQKTVALAVQFVAVSLALGHLGQERYGVLAMLLSFTAMLGFSDFGLGNGLLTLLSAAHGQRDRARAATLVASASTMLAGVACVFILAAGASLLLVDWPRVFNVTTTLAASEAPRGVLVFFALFAVNVVLGVVQRTEWGLQQGYVANLWTVAGNGLSLLGLAAAVHTNAGIPGVLLAVLGGPALAAAANGVVLFGVSAPDLRPRLQRFDALTARKLLGTGAGFMLLQLAAAMAFATDNLVLAHARGAPAVAAYSVAVRLFSPIGIVLGFALLPLWPAYGEAVARGDIAWARRTLWRTVFGGAAAALALSLPLVMAGPLLIRLWVGADVPVDRVLLMFLAVWNPVAAASTALAMFLNGTNNLRVQIVCAVPMAISALALKILLGPSFGARALPLATTAALAVFTIIPLALHSHRLLQHMERSRPRASA